MSSLRRNVPKDQPSVGQHVHYFLVCSPGVEYKKKKVLCEPAAEAALLREADTLKAQKTGAYALALQLVGGLAVMRLPTM